MTSAIEYRASTCVHLLDRLDSCRYSAWVTPSGHVRAYCGECSHNTGSSAAQGTPKIVQILFGLSINTEVMIDSATSRLSLGKRVF